ncbi:hypothetical protein [Schleiferia thermophila]|nr:hypothetical protein [Schleiferia thermophila]
MKNKFITISIFCLIFCSCSEGNRSEQKDSLRTQDTIYKNIDTIQVHNQKKDSVNKDTSKNEKTRKESLPEFEDYESEYQFRYQFYIDKAYDRKTYEKHYKPYTYQSKHLDSLIDIYEKKKEIENKEKSE